MRYIRHQEDDTCLAWLGSIGCLTALGIFGRYAESPSELHRHLGQYLWAFSTSRTVFWYYTQASCTTIVNKIRSRPTSASVVGYNQYPIQANRSSFFSKANRTEPKKKLRNDCIVERYLNIVYGGFMESHVDDFIVTYKVGIFLYNFLMSL